MNHKDKQVARQFRQVITRALYYELGNPVLDCVTVTDVHVTPDLQFADIKVTFGGEDDERVMPALVKASGALKRILAKSVKMRRVPDLRFHLDTRSDDENRINAILDGLHIPPADESEETEDLS